MKTKRCNEVHFLWPFFGMRLIKGLDEYNAYAVKNKLPIAEIFETWRSLERQEELYAQGRTTPGNIVTDSKPGLSIHGYGCAADVVFRDQKGDWTWDRAYPWEKLAEFMKAQGLEWGGDWKSIKDLPHFQLTGGVKAEAAMQVQKTKGLLAIWDEIQKRVAPKLKLV